MSHVLLELTKTIHLELFVDIALYSGFIPLIILLFKKKAFNFKEPIVPFIWITAIASIYEILNTNVFIVNAAYWFQIYPFLEIIGLYYFFSKVFKEKHKAVIKLFVIILLIVYSGSFLLWNSYTNLQAHSLNKFFITLFVVLGCFTWLKDLFKNMEIENLWNAPNFYFISAFLIYYSSTILLFSLGNFIYSSKEMFDLWWVNILASLILRILLALGTWKIKYK